jgi:hypothetical protein
MQFLQSSKYFDPIQQHDFPANNSSLLCIALNPEIRNTRASEDKDSSSGLISITALS